MKTKRLTKLGAVLSAALVLLSGILSVSAASVPQAVIDTGRKASVSLYKYDFTSAHADGVLGDKPKQKTANIKICCCINCRVATKPPRL